MVYGRLSTSDFEVSIICLCTITCDNPVKKKESMDLVHWSMI